MVQIAPLDRSHLPQVLALVNSHLSTVIPGWSLTADYFWERLQSEPQEYITDPYQLKSMNNLQQVASLPSLPYTARRSSLEVSSSLTLEGMKWSCRDRRP